MHTRTNLLLRRSQQNHGAHVDVLRQLVLRLGQLLDAPLGFLGVVDREVVRRVGLSEELALVRDPVILLDQQVHLSLRGKSWDSLNVFPL